MKKVQRKIINITNNGIATAKDVDVEVPIVSNKAEHVVNETLIASTSNNPAPLSTADTWINFLQGNRTYIMGGAGVITVGLWIFKIIDDETANKLMSLFGFGGLIALRASRK